MRTIRLFIPFPSLESDEIFLKQVMPFAFKLFAKIMTVVKIKPGQIVMM